MLVIGHRGSPGFPRFAENTRASFRRAFIEGADGIEFDIRRCADGQLIVFHDDTLDRTTTGSGPVGSLSYAEISKFDAGDGESVPLLTDVLAEFGGNHWLNVELKEPNLASEVADSIITRKIPSVVISGFKPFWEELGAISRKVPVAPLATSNDVRRIGIVQFIQLAIELGARAVHITKESAEDSFIRSAHAAGLAVRVFTVNDPQDVVRLARLGADAIFSDYPGRSKQVILNAEL